MARAQGQPLAEMLLRPRDFKTRYPEWTRRHSVALTIDLLTAIDRFHRINVLLGDLNLRNILLEPETRAFHFVDCDSFQVEGHPCPVGRPEFRAPEVHRRELPNALRRLSQELFGVATLLFMFFLPGQRPYSHVSRDGRNRSGNAAANILNGFFPYTGDGRYIPRDARDVWRTCWTHLSPGLQEAFQTTFADGSPERQRVSVRTWIELLSEYGDLLARSDFTFQTPLKGYDLNILPPDYYHA
jgi:DNA-binding helix-hairpin-helix protein with protein kinase domain